MADNLSVSSNGTARLTGKGIGNKTSVALPKQPATKIGYVQILGKHQTNNVSSSDELEKLRNEFTEAYKVAVKLDSKTEELTEALAHAHRELQVALRDNSPDCDKLLAKYRTVQKEYGKIIDAWDTLYDIENKVLKAERELGLR